MIGLAEYKAEIGAAVTIAVVLAALLAILAMTISSGGVPTSNTSIIHPASNATAPACLFSLPQGSQLSEFGNSTFFGNLVTYPNGTQASYSAYLCPRPAPGETGNGANIFQMATAAESNSSFIATENESDYLYFWPSGLNCSTGGNQQCSLTLFFLHYGSNAKSFECGGKTVMQRDALSGIAVTFTTSSAYDANGELVSRGWNLHDPVIQVMSTQQINVYYGNSLPCG